MNNDDEVIIDIYDNISKNRFNRYVFMFYKTRKKMRTVENNNVFITYIPVFSVHRRNDLNNLYKLVYLFGNCEMDMIDYANSFMDGELIDILKSVIKK